MSKIKELLPEEAAHLRRQVIGRFLRGQMAGSGFRPTSFKGAYEDLRQDIIAAAPQSETSVSLTRLRKLFYYTDPEICPAEQLTRPSFGRDFIEALEQYGGPAGDQSPLPAVPQSRNTNFLRRAWWIALPLLLLFLVVAGRSFFCQSPGSWSEHFDDTGVTALQANGFAWQDFDSLWWSRQLRKGFLTLYTLQGDYWVKPDEKRLIKNLLYRKVKGDCFTVTTKIIDFDPRKNNQQFTVFLLDKNLDRETHLRATASYWTSSESDPGVQHTTTDYQDHGQVTQQGFYHFREFAKGEPKVDTLWLKVVYENRQVSVFQKTNNEWNIWGICAPPFELRFKPAYVGIAAFQGWTNDDGTPRNAEPIPVLVDFIEVEACK